MIQPIRVHKQSAAVGQECALCHSPFSPGDEMVICPEDGSRYHSQCWQANGNHCAAYGCQGAGEIASAYSPRGENVVLPSAQGQRNGRSKVRVRPSTNFGCCSGCLVFIAILTVLGIVAGCFLLWSLIEYVTYSPPQALWPGSLHLALATTWQQILV